MKYVLYLCSMVISFAVMFVAAVNLKTTVDISLYFTVLKNVSIFFVIFTAFALGGISGYYLLRAASGSKKKTISLQNRRLEQVSVDNDSAQARVKVLEAKIKTLEIALEKALLGNQ